MQKEVEKLVYISHVYGGKKENKEHAEDIIIKLIKEYPDITFVSPIHALGFTYDLLTYEDGMRHCLALLDMCDEMWTIQGHDKSRGVQMEIDYCKAHRIPLKTMKRCNDNCEWNNKRQCDIGFCVLPKCVKGEAR